MRIFIDFTDKQYIINRATKDLPLAYLDICWRLAGWLAAQDLQPTFQTMSTCEAYHSHAVRVTMGTAQGVRAHNRSWSI